MALKYGQTWWGNQWLNSLTHIDFDNRLPRGRSYASNGRVKSIEINKNIINAKVKGSYPSPYKITIEIPVFSEKEQQILTACIIEKPSLLAKLLNRELPTEIFEIAEKQNIKIFPKTWKDFKMNCSCPDWAVPCKHLAAVIYTVANEIDKNPFLVFQLHHFDLIEKLKKQDISIESSSKEKIKTIDDICEGQDTEVQNFNFNFELFEKLDFSNIEDISQNLFTVLAPNPLFYPKDFKAILEPAYKSIKKTAKEISSKRTFQAEEEILIEENEKIQIVLDESCKIKQILFSPQDIRFDKDDFANLVAILEQVEDKKIINYNPYLNSLFAVCNFCRSLLQKGAFIPQLIDLKENKYCIRWVPATLDKIINNLFEDLQKLLPSDIVHFIVKKGTSKSINLNVPNPKVQLETLCSLFITDIVNKSVDLKKISYDYRNDEVLQLFFSARPVEFNSFSNKEIPNTIQLWLNKFSLVHKDYVPVLQVNETDTGFEMDVLIENKTEKLFETLTFDNFISTTKYGKVKFDVLKDLTILSGHLPELTDYINQNGKKPLPFDLLVFTEVLLKVLPVIRLLGINILLPKSLKNLVRPQLSMRLSTNSSDKVGSFLNLDKLLEFKWQVALGDQFISPAEFLKLVSKTSGLIKLKDRYILVNQDEIARLMKNMDEKQPKLSSNDLLKIALSEEYFEAKVDLSKEVRKMISTLTKQERIDLPENLIATLRPYQERGYEWLYKNSKLGFGSLIADDMGLGKTLQVIAVLLKFKSENLLKQKKGLIVVPTSLLTNWQKEIEKFAPGLKFHIYHGPKRNFENIKEVDLVISTYGIVRSDNELFEKMKWFVIVVDEAQNIKNPGTDQTKAIKKIKTEIRIAMTGTPVENRLSEYWSIFDFTNKGYLGSLQYFNTEFSYPIHFYKDHARLDVFKKITQPFLLRRVKTDKSIISDLPDKIENNQYCSLTKEQASIYQNVVDTVMNEIETKEGIDRKGLILKLMTALKQICNHPCHYLKKGVPDIDLSGKVSLLFEILENILDANEKVLIFTQYKEMGDLLSDMIENYFKFKPLFLHGQLSRNRRDEMVQEFQTKKTAKIFILSLKAGGTGLNLVAASNVIHFDMWWNPAVEAQATDRAFRIGQQSNVMVYRLITKNTFEEKIDEMLKSKRNLADMAIESGEKWIGDLSNAELKQLVKLK